MTDFPKLAFFPVFLLSVVIAGSTFAYDSPDFDFNIVDTDALHLEPNDQESVVEALNAIACNFPDSKLIDEDLREKALAIALTLDPLNVNSRNAHFALLSNRTPPVTPFYQNSVSEVSEKLWSSAVKMSNRNGQPESRKLGEYLEELSLVIHPNPPTERIKQHARKTDESEQPWKKFVTLQVGDNPSGNKMKSLYQIAKEKPKTKVTPPAVKPILKKRLSEVMEGRPKGPKGAKGIKGDLPRIERRAAKGAAAAGNASEIKLPLVEIPFVARTQGTIRKSTLGGTLALTVRPAAEADKLLFDVTAELPAGLASQMRLTSDIEGFKVNGLELAERFVRRTYRQWPEKMIAELLFDTELPTKSSRRLTSIEGGVATSLLLHSAFSGQKPDQNIIYSGFIDEPKSEGGPSIGIGDQVAELLDQAKQMDGEFVLIPEKNYSQMVDGAIKTRQLEYLFDPQVISFSSWDQLKDTAFGKDADARAAASAEFKKIQAVSSQMSLVDLSRNEKVRERLQKIVTDYPQHLSAKIMLAFGDAPDDPAAVKQEAIRKIDEALEPFISDIIEAIDDETPEDLDFTELKPIIETSDKALMALQNGIAPEIRNYLYQAKEVINDVKSLVASSSSSSATAEQRLSVVEKSLGELQLERSALGLDRLE